MMFIARKIDIPFAFLLSVLLVVTSAASLNSSIYISSFGAIDVSGVILVNFENDDCFKWGMEGAGTGYILYGNSDSGIAPYWDRGGWPASVNPTKLLYQNQSSIVYSGSQAANLTLSDPSAEAYRRLEILHDWDPHSEYMWNIAWYYFPSSLRPVDSWIDFHRMNYERMWDHSKAAYYQYFQIDLSVMTDGRAASQGEQIFVLDLGKGGIDNNNDGVGDIWPYTGADLYSNEGSNRGVPSSWLTKKPRLQVPFDRWFKVVTLVFRNMTDFNNGYIKVWIDNELIWDIQATRTVGIDPAVLDAIDPLPPEPQGYLSSGFGLYTEIGSSPKTIFVDDVIVSNSSGIWLAP